MSGGHGHSHFNPFLAGVVIVVVVLAVVGVLTGIIR